MKKKLKPLQIFILKPSYILLAFLIAFSFSCKPEDGAPGPEGKQGTQGEQGVQGEQGIQGPAGENAAINITYLDGPSCVELTSPSNVYQKIATTATFTKLEEDSYIEIDYQTYFSAGFTSATGVIYELRVDDSPTEFGYATFLLQKTNPTLPGVIHGVFSDLTAGSHTISIWAKSIKGNVSNIVINSGCFSNETNTILIQEFR